LTFIDFGQKIFINKVYKVVAKTIENNTPFILYTGIKILIKEIPKISDTI
jgi:hypothetical protein